MENYLSKLDLERDYDEMMKLMLDKNEIENVKNFFKDVNTKVLLSSFLMKNFNEYFSLSENHDLIKCSKELCKIILNKDLKSFEKVYKSFFDLFTSWRNNDIQEMKQEIEEARDEIEKIMTEHDPVDDAEEQWNHGVKINMKKMDNAVKMLDIYGKTPPKN